VQNECELAEIRVASGNYSVKQLRVTFVSDASGYTEDTIVQHGIVKAGIAFVHKPFTSETLGRNIRDVLNGIEQPKVSLPPALMP